MKFKIIYNVLEGRETTIEADSLEQAESKMQEIIDSVKEKEIKDYKVRGWCYDEYFEVVETATIELQKIWCEPNSVRELAAYLLEDSNLKGEKYYDKEDELANKIYDYFKRGK